MSLNESSQSEKATHHIIPRMWRCEKRYNYGDNKKKCMAKELGSTEDLGQWNYSEWNYNGGHLSL